VGIAPHNPNGPVANVVALHFDFATPSFLIQEDMVGDVPWRFDVEINEVEARKHPFEQEILEQMVFHPDGSVAEW
jgi:galactonate dehydratase